MLVPVLVVVLALLVTAAAYDRRMRRTGRAHLAGRRHWDAVREARREQRAARRRFMG